MHALPRQVITYPELELKFLFYLTMYVFLIVDHQRLQHGDRTAIHRLDQGLDRGAKHWAGRQARP